MLSKNRNLESPSKNAAIFLTFLPLRAKFKIFEFEISNSPASSSSVSSKLYRTCILDWFIRLY